MKLTSIRIQHLHEAVACSAWEWRDNYCKESIPGHERMDVCLASHAPAQHARWINNSAHNRACKPHHSRHIEHYLHRIRGQVEQRAVVNARLLVRSHYIYTACVLRKFRSGMTAGRVLLPDAEYSIEQLPRLSWIITRQRVALDRFKIGTLQYSMVAHHWVNKEKV